MICKFMTTDLVDGQGSYNIRATELVRSNCFENFINSNAYLISGAHFKRIYAI